MTNVLIELNQIDARATREAEAAYHQTRRQTQRENFYTETDEPGENGSPELPEQTEQTEQSVSFEVTRKALVGVPRTITPRHDGTGSRLTFADGGGFAVTETYEQIKAMFAEAGVLIVSRPDDAQQLTHQA